MLKNSRFAIGFIALVIVAACSFFLLKEVPQVTEAVAAEKAADAPAADKAPQKSPEAVAKAQEKIEEAKKEVSPETNLLAGPKASTLDVDAVMKDQVLGKEDAPVTIIEYASMTCPHCAHFATTVLPEVKAKLIETGKAKLIYRDFPLDGIALKAAMMTHCVSPLKYYNMVEVLFSNQERWIKAKDPLESLQQLGALAGMDADEFKSCTGNKELETAILNRMKEAQDKYKVQSTPTFIFNDGAEQFSGAQDIAKFEAAVNKLSGK